MGEFIINGDADKSGLNDLVTADLTDAEIGSCHYCLMLNQKGGIIDDLVAYRLEQEKWMLVVNAATTHKDEQHIRANLTEATGFKDISKDKAKLDIQGPLARDILKELVGESITALRYYHFDRFSLAGERCLISRTGYTGELGYEIYIDSSKAIELWQSLLKDERVKPAGLGARDTLRLEMGYCLYGQDIDDNTTPYEAGLRHFMDLDKEFIGKKALAGDIPRRNMIHFISRSRRAPRHGYRIFLGSRDIGIVTSGSFSPSLSSGIGMGYAQNGLCRPGEKIMLKDGKTEIEAVITRKPFYKNGTVKI
jgi:aminomethyltransferase